MIFCAVLGIYFNMKKIVLTGGGTGGHITPNIALIEPLKSVFDEIHYIGRETGLERDLIEKIDGVYYHGISYSPKLERGKILSNLTVPIKLIRAVSQARKIVDKISPTVIFSKGGFVALPVTLGAGKTPVVLHESDLSMGLANKIASGFADKILTSFDTGIKRAITVGAPLRAEIYRANPQRAYRICGFRDENKPVLLITGGSSGARAINNAVDGAIDKLCEKFNVIHLSGKGNGNAKKTGYYRTEYADNMPDFLSLCSLAVTRGGANTLFELVALKKPMLVIPLPKGASRGDQIDNANYFAQRGCCSVLQQDKLTPATLINEVNSTYLAIEKIITAQSGVGQVDGRRKIVEILSSYVK